MIYINQQKGLLEKMSNDKLLKNTIIIMIGNIGTKLIMFIMVPMYTKWLTTSEYGIFDTLISLGSFLTPIITLQLEQSVFRVGIESKENLDEAFRNTIFVSFIIFIICFIGILIYDKTIVSYMFSLYLLGTVIINIFLEYIRGKRRVVEYSIINICFTGILLITNIIFLWKIGLGIIGVFLAYIISYLIIVLLLVIRYYSLIEFEINLKLLRKQLHFSLPLIPNTICFWITNLSDRFMIMYYLGAEQSGIYAVATKIPTIITMLYSAFVLAWQEEAIHIINTDNQNEFYTIYKQVVSILFCCAWLIFSVLRSVMGYLFDESYQSAIGISVILIIATVFLCLSQFFSGILMAKKETFLIGTSTVIAAVGNVIINFMFLKKGLMVAAISTLIAYILMYMIRMFTVSEFIKIRYLLLYLSMMCLITVIVIIVSYLCSIILTVLLALFLTLLLNRKIIYAAIQKLVG